MLRTVVVTVAAILTCLGVGLIAFGVRMPGWQALILGAVILIGTLFERHYHRIERPGNGRWQSTDEKFIDPTTGNPVEVMYDPHTGERRYVAGDSTSSQNRPDGRG